MNQFLIMSILERIRYLPDIFYNGTQRKFLTISMALAQCSIRGVIHDEKRCTFLHIKIEDTNDMGMYQAGYRLCLIQKSRPVPL